MKKECDNSFGQSSSSCCYTIKFSSKICMLLFSSLIYSINKLLKKDCTCSYRQPLFLTKLQPSIIFIASFFIDCVGVQNQNDQNCVTVQIYMDISVLQCINKSLAAANSASSLTKLLCSHQYSIPAVYIHST